MCDVIIYSIMYISLNKDTAFTAHLKNLWKSCRCLECQVLLKVLYVILSASLNVSMR